MDTAGHCLMCDGPKPITTLLPDTSPTTIMKPTMSLRWHNGILEQLFIRELVGYGGQTDQVWCVVPTA